MKRSTRVLAALLLVLSCIGCDQVTKSAAKDHLDGEGRLSFLRDTIRLEYAENRGAFLGLASEASPQTRFLLLTVMTGALLAFVGWMLVRPKTLNRSGVTALSTGARGWLGNWIDRVTQDGLVVDFLNVGVGSLRTGIFNVADMAITTGVVLLFIGSWREDPKPELEAAGHGPERAE